MPRGAGLALLLFAGCGVAAGAAPLPTRLGQCAATRVKTVSSRLEDAAGHPVPDSGVSITYANGGYQTDYDDVPAVRHSRAGDPVRLCLVKLPSHCPPGDERGKVYKGTNLRTRQSWTLPDAEHMCGGA